MDLAESNTRETIHLLKVNHANIYPVFIYYAMTSAIVSRKHIAETYIHCLGWRRKHGFPYRRVSRECEKSDEIKDCQIAVILWWFRSWLKVATCWEEIC